MNSTERLSSSSTINTVEMAPVTLLAADRYPLSAHWWHDRNRSIGESSGVVVINPATAVRADYYHRYARFLAENGYVVLTYDYRGIGRSRQGNLQRWKSISNSDWGQLDCEAALTYARETLPQSPLYVVAHSIGGMLLGFAPSNHTVKRCIMVGAQYGYWRDYARAERLSMLLRWHVLMPIITAIFGYCPAKVMGWHEDLPAAAAFEWAFRSGCLISTWGAQRMPLHHFDYMTGEILAVEICDDAFGTPVAIDRLLTYFKCSRNRKKAIQPASVGCEHIGHFGFFHDRFRSTLWQESLCWLADTWQ
jgi:predicted alpha/beta hydrolase